MHVVSDGSVDVAPEATQQDADVIVTQALMDALPDELTAQQRSHVQSFLHEYDALFLRGHTSWDVLTL